MARMRRRLAHRRRTRAQLALDLAKQRLTRHGHRPGVPTTARSPPRSGKPELRLHLTHLSPSPQRLGRRGHSPAPAARVPPGRRQRHRHQRLSIHLPSQRPIDHRRRGRGWNRGRARQHTPLDKRLQRATNDARHLERPARGQFRAGGPAGNKWDILSTYNADGVHLNAAGYTALAAALHRKLVATQYGAAVPTNADAPTSWLLGLRVYDDDIAGFSIHRSTAPITALSRLN